MTTFTYIARKVAKDCTRQDEKRLHIIGRWHAIMGWIQVAILDAEDCQKDVDMRESEIFYCLMDIAAGSVALLQQLGVDDPASALIGEYERASKKHPGMTLDSDQHTDESRFYALAEEVGEVCAALTYDNKAATGHNSDLISEVTQVGGLAIAWALRFQEEEL